MWGEGRPATVTNFKTLTKRNRKMLPKRNIRYERLQTQLKKRRRIQCVIPTSTSGVLPRKPAGWVLFLVVLMAAVLGGPGSPEQQVT